MPLSALLAALLPLAWLLPNHYYPWLSAWPEGLALGLLCAAALAGRGAAALPRAWAAALVLALSSLLLQLLAGRMLFVGDALMVLLYLVAFTGALALGSTLPARPAKPGSGSLDGVDALALAMLAASGLSVGIALAQWTGVALPLLPAADLPPGGRPFANLGQANHFCTVAFLGLCALALLRAGGHVGRPVFALGAAWLLLGMAMSGSRTGWLQVLLALVLLALWRRRSGRSAAGPGLLLLPATYAAWVLLWPVLNDALLLSGGRSVLHQVQGGVRLPFWLSMLDALSRQPWLGYGWQQVVLAQQAVALDHPAVGHVFEHSHNLVLDLLLWAGLPLGIGIVACAAWALWRLWQALATTTEPAPAAGRALWLLAASSGVLVHGLLEYAAEYAYFLLPMGLMLGAAQRLAPAGPVWTVPAKALQAVAVALLLGLSAVAVEYLQAEQNHRVLRLEAAHIGTLKIETPAPDLHLLDQLQGYLSFARTEAEPGMGAERLGWMRRVATRYPYPPLMLRHALAAGLNGQPAEAGQVLQRICRMHTVERCDEARIAWAALQRRYPALVAVPAP